MTQAKYFQKLKCDGDFQHSKSCECKGSGIIAGADITSTIKPILEGIDNAMKITNDARHLHGLNIAKQIIEDNVIKVEE